MMDYADGGDIHLLIKKREGALIPESQILNWFVQTALALKHVHDRKVPRAVTDPSNAPQREEAGETCHTRACGETERERGRESLCLSLSVCLSESTRCCIVI